MSDQLAEFVQVSLLLSLLLREPEPPSDDRFLHVLEAFVDAAMALEASTPDGAGVASETVRGRAANPGHVRAAVVAMSARLPHHH